MCNRNIYTGTGSLIVFALLNFDYSSGIGCFFSNLMKRTDAGSVGAGIYQSVFIDEVDVMTTDVVDGVYDLCGKLLSYMCNHICLLHQK